jgi:hypothetical protein
MLVIISKNNILVWKFCLSKDNQINEVFGFISNLFSIKKTSKN